MKAQGMDKVSKNIGAEFVLAIGDNMYKSGVIDAEDSRFNDTFETVYNGENLQVRFVLIGFYLLFLRLIFLDGLVHGSWKPRLQRQQ